MNENELKRFDLNLLVTLKVLLEEGSVSRTATRLHLTQSAVSHALAKLREAFDDELMVRSQHRMLPTPKAISLLQPLTHVLEAAHALVKPAGFDIGKESGVFRLVMTDYGAMLMLPALIRRLTALAPRLTLECMTWSDQTPSQLESGLVDLALGGQEPTGPLEALSTEPLFQDRLTLMTDVAHPLAGKRSLSVQEFVSYPHAIVTVAAFRMVVVDEKLRAIGLTRRVSLKLPHFITAPLVLPGTPLLLTLPEVGARLVHKEQATRVMAMPFDLPTYSYRMFWGAKRSHSPLHGWMRETLTSLGAGLSQPGQD